MKVVGCSCPLHQVEPRMVHGEKWWIGNSDVDPLIHDPVVDGNGSGMDDFEKRYRDLINELSKLRDEWATAEWPDEPTAKSMQLDLARVVSPFELAREESPRTEPPA